MYDVIATLKIGWGCGDEAQPAEKRQKFGRPRGRLGVSPPPSLLLAPTLMTRIEVIKLLQKLKNSASAFNISRMQVGGLRGLQPPLTH